MSGIKTGGPAFPHLRRLVAANTYEPIAEGGMTLRDYFAAKAMQSTMLDFEEQKYWHLEYSLEECQRFTAERAYALADAMLAAREKGGAK